LSASTNPAALGFDIVLLCFLTTTRFQTSPINALDTAAPAWVNDNPE
jgi:hypothetical protein